MMPRVGFLGTGWIGRHRMEAIARTGAVDCVGWSDPSDDCAAAAAELAPGGRRVGSLEDLLALGLDGLVIATPSAFHAEQSFAALDAGVSVFCQKPLGRDGAEAASVVEAARRADRLLTVDFSYRLTAATSALRQVIESGALGDIFAVDLTFHNAWGPDKPWFFDRAQSGGGCVMDLGVHLIDLALWLLGFPAVEDIDARLLAKGRPAGADTVEDYASVQLRLRQGPEVRLACSWHLPAGREAVIGAQFYGTAGGAALRNVAGSFHDFEAVRFHGTREEVLASGPDEWGGRAAAEWARRLSRDASFDPAAEGLVQVAETVERIYRAGLVQPSPALAK